MFDRRIRVAGPGGRGGAARGPSLRAALLALVLCLAATMAGLAAFALWQAQDAAQRQVTEQLLGTARAMARVIDREFARAEALDLPIIGVAGPDGRQLASSLATPERIAAGLPAAPAVMRVFETGATSVGDFTEGNDPGRRRIVLGVPVRAAPGGEVRYALGLVLPRERLLAALQEQHLPAGWVATLVDRQMTVVARTHNDDRQTGRPVPQPYAAQFGRDPDGIIRNATSMDGEPSVLAYARAPVTDYIVAILAPEADFDATRWQALRQLAWLVLPAVAAALGLALLLARRVAEALRGLAQPAAPGARLREVAELGTALAAERQARDQAEVALRERSAWLEAAQRAAVLGVFEWEVEADAARWSEGLSALLDIPPGPLPAGAWRRLRARVLPEDRPALDAALARALSGERPDFAAEFRIRRGDGALRWVCGQGTLLPAGSGRRKALGALIDVTTRRRLEEEREALLRQQEFLAGEIHHRVKNSLQLVLSLLLMQARRAPAEATAALRDAARRVGTVAAVHRRLYEDSAEGATDAGHYLAGLVEDLGASLAESQEGRGLRLVAAPGLHLAPERLAPLGIVATELMTNALKYGAGQVTLRLGRRAEGLVLAVEDEGPGFPPGFDPAASRGLGMRVATTLVRQAGGRLAVDTAARGGRVVITLPEAGG
ncbi:sensor histidine kinase [Paracraurococcus lichenis]|uniref:histidine kinase n=1 Tax=Paracraurococcus lichenis TaxID=3064888 RepID=A0ABT9DX83_9PROT|nr:histidine kinase dimerization/phosphoacceptor domain -containing protein [Paracraurococcus sp. LOR1-02]MDO9708512.1 histidine kinase dimerization/phosphoacceptor domain -containing protein [Paracraurococcus sp. LOR1-02]